MRRDVKVGIVIAVCLAVVAGVWWFVFHDRGKTDGEELAATDQSAARTEDTNVIEFWTPPAGSETAPPTRTETVPREETGRTETAAPAETETIIERRPPPPPREIVDVRPGGAEVARVPTVSPVPEVTLPQTGRPYVVKEGDNFWVIAQREYGNGALWEALREANPKVPPRRMRPGMTIVIPPRPTVPVRVARVAPSGPPGGRMETDVASGKRFYIVKDGDRGFWGIAETVYGHGRYYRLIEAANPDLDPHRLKAGQRVRVPDTSEEPAPLVARVSERPTEAPGAAAPARSVRVRTGAPTSAVLPDGRVFD